MSILQNTQLIPIIEEVPVKTNYIADIAIGAELTNELFLLAEVAQRTTKDGRAYLLCTLGDKSGQTGAVYWNVPAYVMEWARAGTAVLITGRTVSYKEAMQINITDMNPVSEPDLTLLLPSSLRPRQEMEAELRACIAGLAQPWQSLVAHLLLDESFLPQFATAPAARAMHHGYLGGLLEHSLSMAVLADKLSAHYPYVNRDLLIAGALLHDMGKTLEYSLAGSFDTTDDGRLVGHIVRAIVMIEQAAARLAFPAGDLRQLVHLVAAHHGTQEWGSPVTPKSLEAVLLHQIDLLDSRVQGFMDHVRSDGGDQAWTAQSSNMFQTRLQRPAGM